MAKTKPSMFKETKSMAIQKETTMYTQKKKKKKGDEETEQ
jgi:hypothetical protein